MIVPGSLNAVLLGRSVAPTTWNPSDKGSDVVLGDGNLAYSLTAANNTVVRSIFSFNMADNVGRYWLLGITGSAGASNGFSAIANGSLSVSTNELGTTANSWAYKGLDGTKITNNSASAYGDAWGTGDFIGVATRSGSIWFHKNGVWQGGGNPVAGTGAAFTGITGMIFAAYAANATAWTHTANFGQRSFAYPPPAGFVPGLGQ